MSASLATPVFPRVVTDSAAATQLAAVHLREHGFRNFAYCGDAQFHWSGQWGRFFGDHVRAMGGTVSHFSPPKAGARPTGAFRRATGMSPREYRTRHRAG